MIESINNIEDVITFSKELIAEGCNFHPDDDFHSYVNSATGELSYSFGDAELRNDLMDQCFRICELEKADIYNITMEVYLKETGLDKFIPLPSLVEDE